MTAPLETIHISQAPYKQSAPSGFSQTYSGSWAFWANQYSIVALNAAIGVYQFPTGITKVSPPPPGRYAGLVPPPLKITGDCWQSVVHIAASKDTPKWLICTGAPSMCDFQGLQVWKFESGTWRWKGLIDSRIHRLGVPRIVGDLAYAAVPGSTNPRWKVLDLTTLVETGEIATPPEGELQTSIEGSTYQLELHDVQNWTAHKQGGEVPPEPPTDELPLFCPNDLISRVQVAQILYDAMLWLAKEHPADPTTGFPGIQAPAVPDEQQFSDMSMNNPFRPATDALKFAKIVTGKDECAGK